MRRFRLLLFALFALLAVTGSVNAQEKPKFTTGPAQVTLGGSRGQMNLASGFIYVGPEEARRILEKDGDTDAESTVGLIAQPESQVKWFGLFRYDDCGYVRDDEADKLRADDLLNDIRQGTNKANEERRSRGEAGIDVVGWFQPPTYNRQTHTLSWSVIGREQDTSKQVINYTTILFGRYGILSCTVVGDPKDGTALQQNLNTINTSISFPQGRDYPSFRSGDRVAEITMTGLITGGAGAAAYGAAKVGLLAKAGKFLLMLLLAAKKGIVLVFAGIVAGVRKLIAKLSGKSNNAQA